LEPALVDDLRSFDTYAELEVSVWD
jgi:hypothetical protein